MNRVLLFGVVGSFVATAAGTPNPPLMIDPTPVVVQITLNEPRFDESLISGIAVDDFDGDGRQDIAVVWFATDDESRATSTRTLTILFGNGVGAFQRLDIDLYQYNSILEALSVFRNGPGGIGIGDFDGDDDPDIIVTPYFGDEVWFFENLGDRQFTGRLKFPFGTNTTGNFITPPEVLCADLDGDGRDEAVYLVDPVFNVNNDVVHIWRTTNTMSNMRLANWEGLDGSFVQWTRGLALNDLDGDGRPDVCFTGSINPPNEDDPIVVCWTNLNVATERFEVSSVVPGSLASDLVSMNNRPCGADLMLLGINGDRVELWKNVCDGGEVSLGAVATGLAGISTDRGMHGVAVDIDGDSDRDMLIKHLYGTNATANQIQLLRGRTGGLDWTLEASPGINTTGFADPPDNPILRPHTLAARDLWGSQLPEVIAAFGPTQRRLEVVIWTNGCLGEISGDGVVDLTDLSGILGGFGLCQGDAGFSAAADVDRDGCVGLGDLNAVLGNIGCTGPTAPASTITSKPR